MAYEVEIVFRVTQEGEPFHQTTLAYANLGYEQLVQMERVGVQMVDSLVKLGEKQAVAATKRR